MSRIAIATKTMHMSSTQYADASPSLFDSIADMIETVKRFHFTDTRKMTALTDVIDRTNALSKPEKRADFMIGSEIRTNVVKLSAPRIVDASSMLLSTCLRLFEPASTPTDKVLNTNVAMMMNAVPVKSKGLWLKETTYPIPNAMPGTAKGIIVENSMIFRPKNFLRTRRNEITMPSIAVIGVAMRESNKVSPRAFFPLPLWNTNW
jgi:hypothetical protein